MAFLLLTNLGNIVDSVHDLAVLPHPVENLVAAGQVLPLAHLIHLIVRQLLFFKLCHSFLPAAFYLILQLFSNVLGCLQQFSRF